LRKFKDPYMALTSLFPDIGLHKYGKFRKDMRCMYSFSPTYLLSPFNPSKVAWDTPLKRRQFFEKFARDTGFDYRSPDAWYAQSRKKILFVKVCFLSPFLGCEILIFLNIGCKKCNSLSQAEGFKSAYGSIPRYRPRKIEIQIL
jgi:hypothetical protein